MPFFTPFAENSPLIESGCGTGSALDHEALDDTVEYRTVVIVPGDQLFEVADGYRRLVGIKLYDHAVAVFHFELYIIRLALDRSRIVVLFRAGRDAEKRCRYEKYGNEFFHFDKISFELIIISDYIRKPCENQPFF